MSQINAPHTIRQHSDQTSARDRIAATSTRLGNDGGRHLSLLNVNQAAATLAVSKRTVQQLTADRLLAVVKFGRNVRYDLADLQRFAESRKVREIGWKKA